MRLSIDLPPDISVALSAQAAAHHCQPQDEIIVILQHSLLPKTPNDDPALDSLLKRRKRILEERGGKLFEDSSAMIAKARRDELE